MTGEPRPPAADHPAIADHGLVGDLRTAALIDRWGSLNWLCWPRFDDPPVFDRLLDPADGGAWRIAPEIDFEATRRYEPDTNVLVTTFHTAEGTAVLRDLMPVPADDHTGPRIVRILDVIAGEVPIASTLRPGRRFGAERVPLASSGRTVTAGHGDHEATIIVNADVVVVGDTAVARDVVSAGRPLVAVLSHRPAAEDPLAGARGLAADTASWWRSWLSGCELPRSHRAAVARSALTLKLLTHEPSRGIVAAPTTSLPEHLGGRRNWDYRYTWLRDSAQTVLALQELGQHDEAMALWGWLERTADRHGPDLAIAYTLDGEAIPAERTVEHLPGHRGSRPVRVGNDAGPQRQHDVYGHVLLSAAHCYHHMDMDLARPAEALAQLADWAARRWPEPDDSIWEVRSGRDHFTYSEVMCWLALDRAVDLARHGALRGDVSTWAAQRDAVRRHVLERAWNPDRGAFTRTVDGDDLDAATLVAPLVGFLPPDDPRCRATRATVTAGLSDHGLLRRYQAHDGLDDSEGAFLLCTLWLADNHTLDGEPDVGAELIGRVLATANDLGLLAEEADAATGQPLGNFPQGLTHLGIIRSAVRLDRTLGR